MTYRHECAEGFHHKVTSFIALLSSVFSNKILTLMHFFIFLNESTIVLLIVFKSTDKLKNLKTFNFLTTINY